MSMKVERSSVEQVKKRFEALKKKKEEKTKEYDLTERIQELKEEVKQDMVQALVLLISDNLFLLGRETS